MEVKHIRRALAPMLMHALRRRPVVALLGPRQVGKTTLAFVMSAKALNKQVTYLDLELDSNRAKLANLEEYLRRYQNQLLILDEAQLVPELFPVLRGLVDERIRAGERAGQFLLLGSASRDLFHQSSESLAGRIRFLELTPFSLSEVSVVDPLVDPTEKLWFQGGFPDSFLSDAQDSWDWRGDFIDTYLERDIPLFGPNVPAQRMRRFWQMLAHMHGQQVNFSNLGKSLEVTHTTIRNYLDLLTDMYMIRQLPAWAGNTKKRLVKSPKIYLRDTGLLHRLLSITEFDDLLGHPVIGASWEGFVIENILRTVGDKWEPSYFRASTGSEIDLVLEQGKRHVWAVEIKRTLSPKVRAGFHSGAETIGATKKWLIYSGEERYPLGNGVEAIGLPEFLTLFTESKQ